MARLNLSKITSTYFYDFEDPNVINSGWCFVWAWLAHLKCGGELWTYDEPLTMQYRDCHAFIKVGSLYYDSSRPRGVRKMERLSFFGSPPEKEFLIPKQTPEEFRRFWERNGRNISWETQMLDPWPKILPKRPDL